MVEGEACLTVTSQESVAMVVLPFLTVAVTLTGPPTVTPVTVILVPLVALSLAMLELGMLQETVAPVGRLFTDSAEDFPTFSVSVVLLMVGEPEGLTVTVQVAVLSPA